MQVTESMKKALTHVRPRLPKRREEDARINVGEVERVASAVAGGMMALLGLGRQTPGGLALALAGGALIHRGFTGHCYGYEALGIDSSDWPRGPVASVRAGSGVKVEKCFTINRSAADLYRFWSDFENLPRFMSHLESVRNTGPNRSHWVAKGPLGMPVEWDAEVHNGEENRLVAWRSLPGSQVDTAGSVHFEAAAGGRGTTVKVVLKYDPPAGKAGALVARLLGEAPEQQIQEELRRFKQLMEAGEIATNQGQTSCRALR
jgi:uncharacterized membrane protein